MNLRPDWLKGALLAALAALALHGCAPTELSPGEPLRVGAQEGVVVLSLTQSGQRGFDLFFRLSGPYTVARVIRLDAFAKHREYAGEPGMGPTAPDRPDGRVLVLKLPAGAYRIDYWSGETELGGAHGLGFTLYSESFQVAFDVKPGTVSYAGNVHLELPARLNYYANQTPSSYRLELRDERVRDLARVTADFPELAQIAVEERLAQSEKAGRPLRYYVINRSDSSDSLKMM